MNDLQIFNNEEFGEIRTITKDDKTYFAGSDVAKALGVPLSAFFSYSAIALAFMSEIIFPSDVVSKEPSSFTTVFACSAVMPKSDIALSRKSLTALSFCSLAIC